MTRQIDFMRHAFRVLRPPYTTRAQRFLLLGMAALSLGLFIKITADMHSGGMDAFDRQLLSRIVELRVESLNGPAVDITALGSATVLTLFVIAGLLLFALKRRWRDARYLLIGTLGIPVWSTGMKAIFTRSRPPDAEHLVHVTSYSYPSGHTVASTAFYLLIAILASRHYPGVKARALIHTLALSVIVSIGLSRMYLGVHYPSDVLSGFFLGAAWALTLTGVLLLEDVRKFDKP